MSSALEKALLILETVTHQVQAINAADAALLSELPRPTAHRVLQQLESLELLQREPGTERYTIGHRLRRLSLMSLTKFHQTQLTHEILKTLSVECGETCNVGMLDGQEVLYLDRVESDWPLKVQLKAGSRVPIYCTALGKLLLAFAEDVQQRHLLAKVQRVRHTETTIIEHDKLVVALEEIRHRGYAINYAEDVAGLIALAVPIRDPSRHVVAGLAMHVPEARMSVVQLTRWKDRMAAAADEIAELLFQPT